MSDCSGDSFDFLSDIDSDGMSHRSESVENLDEGAEMLPSSSFEEEAVEKSACEEETDNSCSTAHDEDEAAEWELMPRKEHKKEVGKLREQIQSERKNIALILDMITRQTEENEADIYNQLEELKTMCEDMEKTFVDNKIEMQRLNINLLKELEMSNEKCEKLEEEVGKLREQIQSERENNVLVLDKIMRLAEEGEAHICSELEEMKTMCEDMEKKFADNKIEMERLNINLPKELKASNEKCEKLEEEVGKLREQIQSERENYALLQDKIMRLEEENGEVCKAQRTSSSQLEEMKTMCEDMERAFEDNRKWMQRMNINLLTELKASNEKCKKIEEENAKLTIQKDELKARDNIREQMLFELSREISEMTDDISTFKKKHNSRMLEISDELQKYDDSCRAESLREREMIDKTMKSLQEAQEEYDRAVERAKATWDLEDQNEKIDV